LVERTTLNR